MSGTNEVQEIGSLLRKPIMTRKIVDEKEDVPLQDQTTDSSLTPMITGHDERAAILTWYIKTLFPTEYERLKGDADELYVEGIHVEADDVMTIDYTTVNEA